MDSRARRVARRVEVKRSAHVPARRPPLFFTTFVFSLVRPRKATGLGAVGTRDPSRIRWGHTDSKTEVPRARAPSARSSRGSHRVSEQRAV